jgi:zinc transport system substrate-binding protein
VGNEAVKRLFCACFIALSLIAMHGCGQSSIDSQKFTSPQQLTNTIVAESYALKYLTVRLIGPDVAVEFPVPLDTDPKTWQPKSAEIQAMQSADLIIVNGPGADYSQWLSKVSLPESKICHSASKLSLDQYIQVKDHSIVHSHGPEGEHSHPMMVPYTWLDPQIASRQASAIAASLTKNYPAQAGAIQANLESLDADLAKLSARLGSIAGQRQISVITANPNLKFLTRAAGIADHHLLWFEPPTAQTWQSDFKRRVDESGAKVLLTSAPLGEAVAAACDAHGVRQVQVNLLDHAPQSGDYVTEMQKNIELLETAFIE